MSSETSAPYRVLARKYRPRHFDDLIGQETLVRTLTNAINSGRIAHAFMLTGIRGVGKTTTARIIAKALNYTGPDGKGEPTAGPTDDCETCKAIAEDRHPDVLEMDAASHTGVDDIRDLLDGARYAPVSARYKIYIIDEVHMLSKSAFNALLKTLEEPPPHVKFIFATTEIRKVPVTVLSRCQRFDLRRVDIDVLKTHYRGICEKENFEIDEDALTLIARAADGSVRDGLSLLDQAMTLSSGKIDTRQVEGMLGLSGRGQLLELLEKVLTGRIANALSVTTDMHKNGTDPVLVMQDLLDCVHILSRLKAAPEAGDLKQSMDGETYGAFETLSGKLTMASLGRAWQILLKGLSEVSSAPNPQSAMEMVLIRLGYAAELPDPAELVRRLQNNPEQATTGNGPAAPPPNPPNGGGAHTGGGNLAYAPAPQEQPVAQAQADPRSIEDVVSLLEASGEMILATQTVLYVHLVKITPGRLEIRLKDDAPQSFSNQLGKALTNITGARWIVTLTNAPGQPTLKEREQAAELEKRRKIEQIPLVREIFSLFPGAEIVSIEQATRKDSER